jgi:hypothetical protein
MTKCLTERYHSASVYERKEGVRISQRKVGTANSKNRLADAIT